MEKKRTEKKRAGVKKDMLLAVVAVVLAIVAITLGVIWSCEPALDDSYFVSDNTKLVMSLNKDIAAFEEGPYEPQVTRLVYYYTGDKVTGMRVYFDYRTEAEAEEAFDNINMDDKDWALTKRLSGHYIVFEVARAKYDGLTVKQVQKNIESMRAAGGLVE